MFPRFNNLLSPEDSGTGTLETSELSADEILKALGDKDDNTDNGEGEVSSDEKEETEKESEENKETKPEEVDELAELEEELKEPTDDDLELKTPVNRRALKTDYPDIFKKHPGLESTIYRERAYTELLPTIQDAKEALSSLQTLERFEQDLKVGNTTDIMQAVKADDEKAFAKLVDNYLPNLAKVDRNAHDHVISNVTKDIVEAMLVFGKEKDDKDIQAAASVLYQFMFNSTKWTPKQQLSVDEIVNDSVAKEREELNKQKQEFESSKQKESFGKVMTSVNNQVKSTIEKSIDSKDQMTPFVKSKAIDEVLTKASSLLDKDTRFQQIVKQLQDKAGKEKFSDDSLNRIRATYLNKYKAILLPIIKSVRQEALKGSVKKVHQKDEPNDTTERANRDSAVRNNNSGNNKNDASKPLPGESSSDFLIRRARG